EAVGEGLRDERAVVVGLGLETRAELVEAEAGGDRERTDVVPSRSDVVRERAIRPRVAVGRLLAEHVEVSLVVIVDNDIVAVGRRRPEAEDAARREQPVAKDLREQLLRVVVQLARGGLLVEDRRELALELPRVEEELPIDVVDERVERRLDET